MTQELQNQSTELATPLADAVKQVQFNQEVLVARRAELNAMKKVSLPNEEFKLKLLETQKMAEDLLDAEIKLGIMLSELPESQGKRTDLGPGTTTDNRLSKKESIAKLGLSPSTAQRFITLAAHQEITDQLKKDIRNSGKIISMTAVLRAISALKKPSDDNSEGITPSCYIESARLILGEIDLDPASSEEANKIVQATTYYTKEQDGLRQKWYGRVWLNPPDSMTEKFVNKLLSSYIESQYYDENDDNGEDDDMFVDSAIVLVRNAKETEWFNRLVRNSSAIVFISGKIKFDKPDGNSGTSLNGYAFVYLGNKECDFIAEFSKYGWPALLFSESDLQELKINLHKKYIESHPEEFRNSREKKEALQKFISNLNSNN